VLIVYVDEKCTSSSCTQVVIASPSWTRCDNSFGAVDVRRMTGSEEGGRGFQRLHASSVRARNHPTKVRCYRRTLDSRFTNLAITMQGSVCSSVEACAGFHGVCSVRTKSPLMVRLSMMVSPNHGYTAL
jgi:hypothetical protein